nr:hypothetical protein [Candidatus Sigynarchaeota archaeon]
MITDELLSSIIKSSSPDNEKIDKLKKLIDESAQLELEFLDWKVSEPEKKPTAQHLAAMSFHGHGFIIYGVTNGGEIKGVTREQVEVITQGIESKRNDGCLGIYTWNKTIEWKDTVKKYEIKIGAPGLFLFILEVVSASCFIFTKDKKGDDPRFWKRQGSSSFLVNPTTEHFLNQVLLKYDLREKQRQIQDFFDALIACVKFYFVYANLMKDESNPYQKLLRIYESMTDRMRTDLGVKINSGILDITIRDEVYTTNISKKFEFWSGSRIYFQKKSGTDPTIDSLSRVREFFANYSQNITERLYLPITFDPTFIPIEKEIIADIIGDEKKFLDVFRSITNPAYFAFICNKTGIQAQTQEGGPWGKTLISAIFEHIHFSMWSDHIIAGKEGDQVTLQDVSRRIRESKSQ